MKKKEGKLYRNRNGRKKVNFKKRSKIDERSQ